MGLVIGYCKDCEFWEEYKPEEGDYVYESRLGWGNCEIAKGKDAAPVDKTALAYADDYESYKAEFITRPEFGCIQFQSKE